jgi:ribosome modulation factor
MEDVMKELEGKKAFKEGKSKDKNPYRKNSDAWYDWNTGWDKAHNSTLQGGNKNN